MAAVLSWLPSPTAMGVAFVMPASSCITMLLGAVEFALLQRFSTRWDREDVMTAAAGGLAGESLMGIALAALVVAGL